ncbi:MAG TPA: polyphenol oxidase family protein [Candidatus Eremiobacteraceae bacterium]|nr:polyphenol oxidase family protein [Candidatus Eremiobacteraceae bacterium]
MGALDAVQESDLGGGFRFDPRGTRHGVIEAEPLTTVGFQALMSPAGVNARAQSEFSAWAEEAVSVGASRLRGVDQVHGAAVVRAESLRDGGRVEADGIITRSPQDVAVIMAADCAPVWIADPANGAVTLVHAGWRGVVAGVVEAGVLSLDVERSNRARIVAAIGPHLQTCCFEVGPEVAVQFQGHTRPASTLLVGRRRGDSVALDLASAIRARLATQGVNSVHIAHACTRCRADILHSYRRNGKGGPLMGAIAVTASGSF